MSSLNAEHVHRLDTAISQTCYQLGHLLFQPAYISHFTTTVRTVYGQYAHDSGNESHASSPTFPSYSMEDGKHLTFHASRGYLLHIQTPIVRGSLDPELSDGANLQASFDDLSSPFSALPLVLSNLAPCIPLA